MREGLKLPAYIAGYTALFAVLLLLPDGLLSFMLGIVGGGMIAINAGEQLRKDRIRRRAHMNVKLIAIACLSAVIALAVTSPTASAATTGSWTVTTFSGSNQTSTFQYPGTVNATVAPVNITVAGQRTVTISAVENSSKVYFSTSIGFYAVGTNASVGRVNVSWQIPRAFQDGAVLTLSVGLSGVKTPESSVIFTIKQNLTAAILQIVSPIISGFQNQITILQQKLDQARAQESDDNFRNQQIEALMGIAIAGLVAYNIYDKRKKSSRKQEYDSSAGEFEHTVISIAVENAEPGEKAGLQDATKAKGTS